MVAGVTRQRTKAPGLGNKRHSAGLWQHQDAQEKERPSGMVGSFSLGAASCLHMCLDPSGHGRQRQTHPRTRMRPTVSSRRGYDVLLGLLQTRAPAESPTPQAGRGGGQLPTQEPRVSTVQKRTSLTLSNK